MFDELIKEDKGREMAHIGPLCELKEMFGEYVAEIDLGRKNRLKYRFMGMYGRLRSSDKHLVSLSVVDSVDKDVGLLISDLGCSIVTL